MLKQQVCILGEKCSRKAHLAGLWQFASEHPEAPCSAASIFACCRLERTEAQRGHSALLLISVHSAGMHNVLCKHLPQLQRRILLLLFLQGPKCPSSSRLGKCAGQAALECLGVQAFGQNPTGWPTRMAHEDHAFVRVHFSGRDDYSHLWSVRARNVRGGTWS